MVADDMLAFIAHNFYVQEHGLAKFKASNWEHVDGHTQNLYLYRAAEAISKWKQRGMSLNKIQQKLLVKEEPDNWLDVPPEGDNLTPGAIRLGTRMNDLPPRGLPNPYSDTDDDLPF